MQATMTAKIRITEMLIRAATLMPTTFVISMRMDTILVPAVPKIPSIWGTTMWLKSFLMRRKIVTRSRMVKWMGMGVSTSL